MDKSIILIGMPGCGKTTIGKRLSKKLGLKLIDTDKMVEKMTGKAIPAIFKDSGEEHFRRLETEALKKAVEMPRCIVSCGGGIVTREENRELLKRGFTVLINRPLDRLAKKGRPLSESRDLGEIYSERIGYYKECADIEIDNDNIDKSTEQIMDLIKK